MGRFPTLMGRFPECLNALENCLENSQIERRGIKRFLREGGGEEDLRSLTAGTLYTPLLYTFYTTTLLHTSPTPRKVFQGLFGEGGYPVLWPPDDLKARRDIAQR